MARCAGIYGYLCCLLQARKPSRRLGMVVLLRAWLRHWLAPESNSPLEV